MGSLRAFAAGLSSRLADVLAPRGCSRSLPREAFVDPASFALDAATLFRDRWVAVAHTADLVQPGSWCRATWPGRGDLVSVRNAELELVLLSAICRHRGVPLVEGESGHLPRLELTCPYHGWAYDLTGQLRRLPGLAGDTTGLGLRVGAATATGPFVFAALGAAGSERGGPRLPPWLERASLATLKRAHRSTHVVRANWKLLVGNFQESHHFPHVHPGLEARTPFSSSSSVVPDHDHWLGGTMDLAPGLETVSGSGRLDGRPFIAAIEHRAQVHDAWIAPNLLVSLQPDYLLTYRLEPEAVDRTRVAFAIDVHQSAPDVAIASGLEDLVGFWSKTNAEDRAICEAQQRGLACAGDDHRPGPRTASEDGLDAFEKIVARSYLAHARPEAP